MSKWILLPPLLLLLLLMVLVRADVTCTAGRWTQMTPLMDRSFVRTPTPFPQQSASSTTPITKATWTLEGTDIDIEATSVENVKDCRAALSAVRGATSEVALMNEQMSFENCVIESETHANYDPEAAAAAAAEALQWQWREVRPQLLPAGSVRLSDGGRIDLLFQLLPLGRGLVFPVTGTMTLVCPLRLTLHQFQGHAAFHIDTLLPIKIRSTQAEVSLVSSKLQLPNTMLHMKPRGAPVVTVPADVDEKHLNKEGLHLRVSIAGDMLIVPLRRECIEALGPSAARVAWSEEEMMGGEGDDDMYASCIIERRWSLEAVKRHVVEAFTCQPLPCLNSNHLYNVSRLAVDESDPYQALPMDAKTFGGTGGFLGDAERSTRQFAEQMPPAAALASGDDSKTQYISELKALVRLWSSYEAEGTSLLRTKDIVTLSDNYAELHIGPTALAQRGFLLPSVRHVCWWLHHVRSSRTLPSLTSACQDPSQRSAILEAWHEALSSSDFGDVDQFVRGLGVAAKQKVLSESSRFYIQFDSSNLWTIKTNVTSSLTAGDPIQFAPFSMGARWIIQSTNVLALPTRGIDLSDLRTPHPSLRYQISHPHINHGDRWVRLDGASLLSLTLDCLTGRNNSFHCPLRFGIVAEHLPYGWEATLDRSVMEHTLYLVCPEENASKLSNPHSTALTCGAQYYGKYEALFAHWVRKEWIHAVEKSDASTKVFSFVLASMTDEVSKAFVEFGQPLYVVIQLPQRLAVDDHRHPIPRGSTEEAAGTFGFLLLPHDAPKEAGSHSHSDEL
ncbi:Hypothetical protein, putative [Bodo saltans]|uniref:Membrane-associated protein n=1 Tax=Bodo saltans TaxID=75058 RepID=A0A0S4IT16_BODSA|nr:Hypothetical protein, putative [Bodo saltans]|eukprot:CUF74037.1 Hypothetical protein, putative [Bodo saltans]